MGDSDNIWQRHEWYDVRRRGVRGLENIRSLVVESWVRVSRNAYAHIFLEHVYGLHIGYTRIESPAPGAAPIARRVAPRSLLGYQPVLCRSAAGATDAVLRASGHATAMAPGRKDGIQPGGAKPAPRS